MRKPRVVVPVAGAYMRRNFIDSGALAELARHYDVSFWVPAEDSTQGFPGPVRQIAGSDIQRRSDRRNLIGLVSMRRYGARSGSFRIKYEHQFRREVRWQRRLWGDVMALPGVFELLMWWEEFRHGVLEGMAAELRGERPDLLVVPTGFADSFSVDAVKAARQAGVPSLMLMFNWDNVSTKGILPVLPDHMAVWGEQSKRHAVEIHRLPPERVHILGAAQFEVYRQAAPESARLALRARLGAAAGEALILFAGVSRFREEIPLLARLNQAIEAGELPPSKVVYRPHPARIMRQGEDNLFNHAFKHVVLDPQLEEIYRHLVAGDIKKAKRIAPDYAYYPELLGACDLVVSSLSTMCIEAMLLSRPVVLLSFPDPHHPLSFDLLRKYDHHDCWDRFHSVVDCRLESELVPSVAAGLRHAADPAQINEDAQYVVSLTSQTYASRLHQLVAGLWPTPVGEHA